LSVPPRSPGFDGRSSSRRHLSRFRSPLPPLGCSASGGTGRGHRRNRFGLQRGVI